MQINSTSGVTLLANPAQLVAEADPSLFALFRAGLHLHVWRNSTPHNWWLDHPSAADGRYVYHWESGTRPSRAFFEFAKRVSVSAQKVSYGGWMRRGDEGAPVSEAWAFDEELYNTSIQRWETAVACAQTFNCLQGSAFPNVASLTSYQRAVLRRLKRKQPQPMLPDIPLGKSVGFGHPDDVDLCARGFAVVDPAGFLTGTELLFRTVIPSEKSIRKATNPSA